MVKRLGGVVLLLLFGGCTSDWDTARKTGMGSAAEMQAGKVLQSGGISVAARSRPRGDFALLPDKGELLTYDARQKVRVSGAYSAYAVQLSEAHALKAAYPGGRMVFMAPGGQPVALTYERHVEHLDGNWSWIGRDASGADAVITFGEKAAFGTVPLTGEEPLRLTMEGGRVWLVVTDRSRIQDGNRGITRNGGPDFLIPPKVALGAASGNVTPAAVWRTEPAMAAAVTGPTVDVVLGYTTGLAAALGGDSQAVTRLNNLVDITNQAYANSAINASLRLVGTVSVNYTDSSDNGDTLEKLSGYKSGTGPITPDPAFAALRAARETHNADLVSLVRDFRTPQNNGCGIAWLIGSDQTPVETSDSPFGYSVVSDGSDLDEGDNQTYFCRDESLAHELGHNMGQAHNIEDSSGGSGAHAYSYGYRETTSNGFYTVMAYRLTGSNQFAIRHFANPAINSNGRPTGIANQSDNVRSMSQTIPIIASFRTPPAPPPPPPPPPPIGKARNDMNRDGKSDIVWRNTSLQQLGRWYMNGPTTIGGMPPDSMPNTYRVAGVGDFDGDGRSDVLWTDNAETHLLMWLPGADGAYRGSYVSHYPTGWRVAGIMDINGDGKSDIVWRNISLQQVGRWLMSGPSVVGGMPPDGMPEAYRIVGTGDFDGDGRGDLLWTDNADSHLLMWRTGADGLFQGSYVSSYPAGWRVAGIVDLNGDGKSDIVWRNISLQQVGRWFMNGPSVAGGMPPDGMPEAYRIVATGDFDGDGRGDLLWTDNADSHLLMWRTGANGLFQGNYVGSYPAGWSVANGTF